MSAKLLIVGTGRCGTELLVNILNLHPDLLVFNEAMFLFPAITRYGRKKVAVSDLICFALAVRHVDGQSALRAAVERVGVSNKLFEKVLQEIGAATDELTAFELLEEIGSRLAEALGKKYWAEKCPDGGYFLKQVNDEWPETVLVHLMRRGVPSATSMQRHDGFRCNVATNSDLWVNLSTTPPDLVDFLKISREYKNESIQQYLELWGRRLLAIEEQISLLRNPSSVHRMIYEELLANPIDHLADLAIKLGVTVTADWLGAASKMIAPDKVGPRVSEAHPHAKSALAAERLLESLKEGEATGTIERLERDRANDGAETQERRGEDSQGIAERLLGIEHAMKTSAKRAAAVMEARFSQMERVVLDGRRLKDELAALKSEKLQIADKRRALDAENEHLLRWEAALDSEAKRLQSFGDSLRLENERLGALSQVLRAEKLQSDTKKSKGVAAPTVLADYTLVSVAHHLGVTEAAIALSNTWAGLSRHIILYREAAPGLVDLLRAAGIDPIPEGALSKYISFEQVRKRLRAELRHRTGWYLQQFLQIAGGLFLAETDDILLSGGDFLLQKNYRPRSSNGKIFLNIVPHAERNWDLTLERLGAINDNRMHSFVCEHVVTTRRILEHIIRKTAPKEMSGSSAFRCFVFLVLQTVNAVYGELLRRDAESNRDTLATDPPLMEDLFSEYQYISLMMMKDFGDDVLVRNISHIRYFSNNEARPFVDRMINATYDVVVLEK